MKLSVVSYLNSKPFIYGLENSPVSSRIELHLDIPSLCAAKLLDNRVDIGLIPVAVLPELSESHILTDFCIGADGDVISVLLLSEVPLESIQSIYLDYQSRTSVMLARILAAKLWKINPEWKPAEPGFESEISGSTAGIVIGDRALLLRKTFRYIYDLSGEWKKLTGLPFVFACWVANKRIPPEFEKELNEAFKKGVNSIEEVVQTYGSGLIPLQDAKTYLRQNIDFNFDSRKKEALNLFLSFLKEMKESDRHPPFALKPQVD